MANILSPTSCYPTTQATKITQNKKTLFNFSRVCCRNKGTSIQHPGNETIFLLILVKKIVLLVDFRGKDCSFGKVALFCLCFW